MATARRVGKKAKQSDPLFLRAGRILDHFRRAGQRVQPVERPKPAARPERRSAEPGSSSIGITLRIVFQSVREAFAAHRRYQELRSQGMPHRTAIRQALEVEQEAPQGDPANHLTPKEQHK